MGGSWIDILATFMAGIVPDGDRQIDLFVFPMVNQSLDNIPPDH